MSQSVKRLSDYRPCLFLIDDVHLDFDLHPTATTVRARLSVIRTGDRSEPLVLNGDGLALKEVRLDGQVLDAGAYEVSDETLTILAPPRQFVLETTTTINPSANTKLSGLYRSGDRFCTHCEAEGFRRITYFLDRPDVLARYTVRIVADKAACPTLLSNGDRTDAGDLADGRHYAVWNDPYPKPAYLFALVAGTFEVVEDTFVTASGKPVALSIHVEQGNGERAQFAMDALKRAMRWDEIAFRREYDLSQFHIVAVRDFSAGAMENKGLNIFNASALLASSVTETDTDFDNVERVVAHEYFHNWTGNRITVRDWFQLCLKEGLTVYRDQEFTRHEHPEDVQRIKDVEQLRGLQYPEDAGPLAHPIRPSEFVKPDNFYTPTVYRKAAEVIRVLRALLGPDAFAAGMQRYFEKLDGQAVTVEDFIACFEETSKQDLRDFFHWYSQAGTPHVTVRFAHDAATRQLTLSVAQMTPPTPGQAEKHPLPIPLRVGFLAANGRELDVRLDGEGDARREHYLVLRQAAQTWTFADVAERPIPAVMRRFMAPVVLDDGLTFDDRLVQMAHEPDTFTRWDAGQNLMMQAIVARAAGRPDDGPALDRILDVLASRLDGAEESPSFVALALEIPPLSRLVQVAECPDPDALFAARETVRRAIAERLEPALLARATDPRAESAERTSHAKGLRALRAVSMRLLAALGDTHERLLMSAFTGATTMTGSIAALRALSESQMPAFDDALEMFEARWRSQPLVMDKWFSLQAAALRTDADRIRALTRHELFTYKNPNRARAVFVVFGSTNLHGFHAADGSGYELMGDAIREIDAITPSVAGRLVRMFESWKRFDPNRRDKCLDVLRGLAALPKLSPMQRELIEKMIA